MMNWYKQSQSIQLQPSLTQNGFSEPTVFPKVKKTIESFEMEDVFSNLAEQHDYRNSMDFILCHFVPSLKTQCKDYYDAKGEKLMDSITELQMRQIDDRLSAILTQTLRK